MNRNSWTILCLAYAIGLLSTSILGSVNPHPSWQQWVLLILGLSFLTLTAALVMPKFLPRGFKKSFWILAGMVALLATIYFQLRIPQPTSNDVSSILTRTNSSSEIVTVRGQVLTQGKITANQRLQFWFKARNVTVNSPDKLNQNQSVTGKLYVTLPIIPENNFYPDKELTIRGTLYQPQSATNPGSFNFKQYLARQGAFAGLKGETIEEEIDSKKSLWNFWMLRQRIVNAQSRWLEQSEGLLISSIVLGQKAVNLPPEMRDHFTKVGLAHILAASGFHVSLLLGLVIGITQSFRARSRLIIGVIILLIYIGLTGIQPSVVRAALMGLGALIALVSDRKVRPLGSLLLAATILLIINPLWIWDLGFQLSCLATLGLIVTMPVLRDKLNWLPPAIATAIATPIAASIWTLPLLIYVFNTLAIYSIPVNIITAPLTLIISIGGMVSAGLALIYPLAGSAIAWSLQYPTYLLVQIVYFFNTLPGNSLAVGKISLGVMVLVYALIILVWQSQWCRIRWQVIGLFVVALIVIPRIYHYFNLVEVTVLSTFQEPVVLIQDRGKVTLINSGDRNTAKYSILPLLSLKGINTIDRAVEFQSLSNSNLNEGWSEIQKSISVRQFLTNLDRSARINAQPLNKNRPAFVGSTRLMLLGVEPPMLQFKVKDTKWLLIPQSLWDKNTPKNFFEVLEKYPRDFANSEVILWSGRYLRSQWLRAIDPQSAIAFARYVSDNTQKQLKQRQIELYWTGRDGAIRWTPNRGFQTTIATDERETDW